MTWYIKGSKNGINLYYAGEQEVSGMSERKDKWVCAGTPDEDEVDQRFSNVASLLSRAPVLEDKEKFRDWILANLRPVRGRRLHVECLESCMDRMEIPSENYFEH